MSVARGGTAIFAAKVYFIFTGLAQQLLLPRALGLAGYGQLARVFSLIAIVSNVVIIASMQRMSRLVAEGSKGEDNPSDVHSEHVSAAMRFHVWIGIFVSLGFALAAYPISRFISAPEIFPGLLMGSLVVGTYCVYAPVVGIFNGRREFVRQATFDVVFATVRTALVVIGGFVFVSLGLRGFIGSTVGFALATILVTLVALLLAKPFARTGSQSGAVEPEFDRKIYSRTLIALASSQLFTNLLMQSDLLVLSRVIAGHTGPTLTADEWVGVYRSCQLFAFLPFQLLLSVSNVLFPLLAKSSDNTDTAERGRLVERGVGLALLLLGLFSANLFSFADVLLRMTYGTTVATNGTTTLRILLLGQGAFTMMGLFGTVLSAVGKERTSVRLNAMALLLMVLLAGSAVRLPFAMHNLALVEVVAAAGSLALVLSLLVFSRALMEAFGNVVRLRTLLTVVCATLLAAIVGTRFPRSFIGLIAGGASTSLVYVCIVLLLDRPALAAVIRMAKR
ncbi:MAG: hypothetical protein KBF88_11525 [Polyangiaceae bacterium]|nr:hypothetical protein [Polyangiaceae bacterium]